MELTSTRPHFLKWGGILGVALAAYSVIIAMSGLAGQQAMGYVSYLIILIAVILGLREYKAENQGFMTFGKGVGLGTMASLIGGALSGILMFFYMKFINPGYIDMIREAAYQGMEKQAANNPAMTDEAMEMAMKWTDTMTSPPVLLVLSIAGTLIVGLILSLIVAAIMKQNPPEEMEA